VFIAGLEAHDRRQVWTAAELREPTTGRLHQSFLNINASLTKGEHPCARRRHAPCWLGAEALGRLTLGTIRYLGPLMRAYAVAHGAPAAPSHARLCPRLLLYDGGEA
jgi:hypothetical protein